MYSRHLQDMSSRHLQDISSRRLQDMSSRRLQGVFNVTIFRLPRLLQDISLRHLQDMSSRHLQDMSSRRLQDVLEDVKLLRWRRLQDVFKTNKCLLRTGFHLHTNILNQISTVKNCFYARNSEVWLRTNPANAPRIFQVETTWKQSLQRGIHVVCLQGR